MNAMNMALGGAAFGREPYGHNQWYYDCTRFSNNRTATMHQTTNSSTAFKSDGHQEHQPQKQQMSRASFDVDDDDDETPLTKKVQNCSTEIFSRHFRLQHIKVTFVDSTLVGLLVGET